MKAIMLTQGKMALVDDDVYYVLDKFSWCAHNDHKLCYAKRWIRMPSPDHRRRRKQIKMEWCILGFPSNGMVIDHVNGNSLDNRIVNLRFVTVRQNCQNMHNRYKTSKYPGVCWVKDRRKWAATITIDDKDNHLGHFVSEQIAFRAYKKAVENLGQKVVGDY